MTSASEQTSASKQPGRLTAEDRQRIDEWANEVGREYSDKFVAIGTLFRAAEYATLYERSRQPDELSKEAEHWKKRWEVQCEAVDVAQTSVTNLHFELSKAQERERWREIAVDGLPPAQQKVLWRNNHGNLVYKDWMKYTDQDDEWAKRNFSHWREIELPS